MSIHEMVPYMMPIWVDRGVLPLVYALNLFPHIQTQSSCQGDEDGEYNRWPNVQFTAGRADLFALIAALQEYPKMISWELHISDRGIYHLEIEPSAMEGVCHELVQAAERRAAKVTRANKHRADG